MSAWYFVILLLILLIFYAYTCHQNICQFFERSDIPYVKSFFIFGEEMDMIFKRKSFNMKCTELYRKLDGYRFGGVIFSGKPAFFIRDPELFNTMVTKDYAYFEPAFIGVKEKNSITAKIIGFLRGEEWKVHRQKIIQLFSNKKLKLTLPTMQESMDKLIPYFEELSAKEYVLVEEISLRYMSDLSTCILFGTEESWLENPHSRNFKLIQDLCNMSAMTIFSITFPDLSKLLVRLGLYKPKFFSEENIETFRSIALNELSRRKIHNIQRNDFLGFLMELKINESAKPANYQIMSDNFIVGSAISLLSGGLLTTTNTLNTCLAELSINQNVQNKLRKEILEVLGNNEELSFELLQKMTYLDMIISETLRRRGTFNRKLCFQDYRIPGTNVVIPQGTYVIMSVERTHMDRKYYEKPEEFYPEHFTDEAKSKRPKCAFVPFGTGPRMCIGNRLALLQLKVALINIIKNFKLEVSSKVEKPIDMRGSYMVMPESSYSLKITFSKV